MCSQGMICAQVGVTQSHIAVTYIVVAHDALSLVSSWMHRCSMPAGWAWAGDWLGQGGKRKG